MTILKLDLNKETLINEGLDQIIELTGVRSKNEALRIFMKLMLPVFELKIRDFSTLNKIDSINSNQFFPINNTNNYSDSGHNHFPSDYLLDKAPTSLINQIEGGFNEEFDNLIPE